jgi:hypothetical protein
MAKSIQKWTIGSLTVAFGLKRTLENYLFLDDLMDVSKETITTEEVRLLEKLRIPLLKNFLSWNEETLKMKFISLLLHQVQYDNDDIQVLYDAEIKGKVDSISLKAIADFTVARTVEDVVQTPYFYFHEYKRKKNNADDPIAQVLIPSLIAQSQNNDNQPILGCYVIGELWYFMVLHGKEYAIGKGLDATDIDGLSHIFLILKKIKTIIWQRYKQ